MKRIAITAGACVALAVPALLGTAGAQSGPPPGTLELHQLERDVRSAFVDAPPRRRESAGDTFTVSGRVRDAAGRPAGTAQAVFTQTRRGAAQGSATLALSGGQIVIAGGLAGGDGDDTLVIAGGSGAYSGASGTVRITEGRGRTSSVFSFGG
jgi:hypothetical protein